MIVFKHTGGMNTTLKSAPLSLGEGLGLMLTITLSVFYKILIE